MRYLKLALGVILTSAGLSATFVGLSGVIFYLSTCFRAATGTLDANFCQAASVGRDTILWLLAAIGLDVGAVAAIRHRGQPWRVRPARQRA